jgi:NAD-dependent SIR2 family protein deacetylase
MIQILEFTHEITLNMEGLDHDLIAGHRRKSPEGGHDEQAGEAKRMRRAKLPKYNSLDDVCHLLKERRKILVLTGAGVSVSAGIPDFRSKDGIYEKLRLGDRFNMPEPTCMFDKEYFESDPRPFFSFAHELWPGKYQPTPTHQFIKILEAEGKLLRNYTQNIDTLEHVAGIERVIYCHGSFATATCVTCQHRVDATQIQDAVMAQELALCDKCAGRKERGETDPDELARPAFGVMKPDIVFFGERLPNQYFAKLEEDLEEVDLVVAIGTSLKVSPVRKIIGQIGRNVPAVLINREVVGQDEFDVELLGNCDAVIGELCGRLGWALPDPAPTTGSVVVDEPIVEDSQDCTWDAIVSQREKLKSEVEEGMIVRHGQSRYLPPPPLPY